MANGSLEFRLLSRLTESANHSSSQSLTYHDGHEDKAAGLVTWHMTRGTLAHKHVMGGRKRSRARGRGQACRKRAVIGPIRKPAVGDGAGGPVGKPIPTAYQPMRLRGCMACSLSPQSHQHSQHSRQSPDGHLGKCWLRRGAGHGVGAEAGGGVAWPVLSLDQAPDR
jgi:hypothetical protein